MTYKEESTTLFSVFFQIKTFKVLSAIKIIIVYRELENEAVNENTFLPHSLNFVKIVDLKSTKGNPTLFYEINAVRPGAAEQNNI